MCSWYHLTWRDRSLSTLTSASCPSPWRGWRWQQGKKIAITEFRMTEMETASSSSGDTLTGPGATWTQ